MAVMGNLPAQMEFRLGIETTAYTLSATIVAADYYSVANAFYEIAFLDLSLRHKKPFATLALRVLYEGGLYGSDILDNIWHHGPGVGVILYTPYVALAAIELQYSYDIVSKGTYFVFAFSKYL